MCIFICIWSWISLWENFKEVLRACENSFPSAWSSYKRSSRQIHNWLLWYKSNTTTIQKDFLTNRELIATRVPIIDLRERRKWKSFGHKKYLSSPAVRFVQALRSYLIFWEFPYFPEFVIKWQSHTQYTWHQIWSWLFQTFHHIRCYIFITVIIIPGPSWLFACWIDKANTGIPALFTVTVKT